MELILKKEMAGLIPMPESYEEFNDIKNGDIVRCKITKPRNIKFHRKFFSLLNFAYEHRQDFEELSFENFRAEIIRRCGFYDEYRSFTGRIEYIPKSISFSKMDNLQFEILYNKSIDVILKYVLCGMKEDELKKIIEVIIGY